MSEVLLYIRAVAVLDLVVTALSPPLPSAHLARQNRSAHNLLSLSRRARPPHQANRSRKLSKYKTVEARF